MIVCICKAINDKTIKQAITDGAKTVCDIKRMTGACTQCCKCAKAIHMMVTNDDSKGNNTEEEVS